MFNKQKEEIKSTVEDVKVSFTDNVKHVMKESKVMLFLASCTTCLITGFIMGTVTTVAISNGINKINR